MCPEEMVELPVVELTSADCNKGESMGCVQRKRLN